MLLPGSLAAPAAFPSKNTEDGARAREQRQGAAPGSTPPAPWSGAIRSSTTDRLRGSVRDLLLASGTLPRFFVAPGNYLPLAAARLPLARDLK